MAGKSPCPVKNCTKARNDNQLMCLHHWRRTPKLLKNAVWDTYLAWGRVVGAALETKHAAAVAMRDAQRAAIAAVEEKERNETLRSLL